jgi:hypothetical protein
MRQHVIRAKDLQGGDYIILSDECRAMVVAVEHYPGGPQVITHELREGDRAPEVRERLANALLLVHRV